MSASYAHERLRNSGSPLLAGVARRLAALLYPVGLGTVEKNKTKQLGMGYRIAGVARHALKLGRALAHLSGSFIDASDEGRTCAAVPRGCKEKDAECLLASVRVLLALAESIARKGVVHSAL